MPKVVNHDERRIEIAHATWAAVQAVGVENLTLRDITSEAGFTTGVLTHYFRDKDSVLRFSFTIACSRVFERILNANKSVENELECIKNAMIEMLAAQEFNEMIPAGIPNAARIPHKTGWITRIHHDAALVYPLNQAPYTLVILTEGITKKENSGQIGAEVAALAHEAVLAARRGG